MGKVDVYLKDEKYTVFQINLYLKLTLPWSKLVWNIAV